VTTLAPTVIEIPRRESCAVGMTNGTTEDLSKLLGALPERYHTGFIPNGTASVASVHPSLPPIRIRGCQVSITRIGHTFTAWVDTGADLYALPTTDASLGAHHDAVAVARMLSRAQARDDWSAGQLHALKTNPGFEVSP
jgi:hypothetical protein